MQKQYLVGIDVGTSGCKSILIDDRGAIFNRATCEYQLLTPRPGWYEQNPGEWWAAVQETVTKVVSGFEHVNNIRAIGLSGQMHGMVVLDKNGEVLRPCIIWADLRASEQCDRIYELVGGQDRLLKLINNKMLMSYTANKILWLKDKEPRHFEKTKVVLNPKDYIRYKLTGEYATDVSDASGTGLFDVKARQWSRQMLETLAIQKEIIPRCYESHEITGTLLDTVAERLGLHKGLAVVGGGGDAVVQSTGTGVVESGVFGTIIGSGGLVEASLDTCRDNTEGRLQIFCHNLPNKWHVMGVMLSAGLALKWFRDILCAPETSVAELTGQSVFELLDLEAGRIKVGAEGLMFLPHLLGQRCPFADPDAKGAYIGLSIRHSKSHMIRSLMEGVIFSLKEMTEVIGDLGVEPKEIRMSGGGANSALWRQIHADVFEREVRIMNGAAEGGAFGAALLAGAGSGVWKSTEDAVRVLRTESHTKPNETNVKRYRELYTIYKQLYLSIRPIFEQLAGLADR